MKKDKKLIQCVWGLFILVVGLQTTTWAEEVATQAGAGNGNFVPVISADQISNTQPENNSLPSQNSENVSALILPSDASVEIREKVPSVKEVLGELGLNEKETQAFLAHTESTLQSIDKALKSQTVSQESYDAVEKQFRGLLAFASRHSDNENVIEAVTAVIGAFFEKVEKKTALSAQGSDDSVLSESKNLLRDLLDYESNDKENHVIVSADSSLASGPDAVDSPERAKQQEQVMEQVLEILRKGAVDSQSPAVSRAIYRSWYLSVSKKARDLRFSRLRAMMLRQQNAETPAPAI